MTETIPRDVFVSYSSKDQRMADLVVSALEERGMTCWIAPRDIPPGSSWPQSIPPAIEASRSFLLIFSGNSDASGHVLNEVTIADRAKKPMLPLRIEDIEPVDLLYFLAKTQWVEAALPPIERHLEKLGDAVFGILKTIPGYGSPASSPTTPQAQSTPTSAAQRTAAARIRAGEHRQFLDAAQRQFNVCEVLDGYTTIALADKIAAWQHYLDS